MHLLLIDNDRSAGKSLEHGLSQAGHECVWVKNGKRGLEEAESFHFDAIVLDPHVPELSGKDLMRRMKAAGVRTPVIMLSSQGAVEERVAGLKAGADDYMVKPAALPELLARLESVHRRVADRPSATFQAGPMTLDLATRRVRRAGKEIDLTPTEFSILEMLLRFAGQVVTRKMLCEQIWADDREGQTNVIEVHIKRLRDKLADAGEPNLIRTVRGRGYAARAL
jgi:two-component system OmpR family response regulator/two-component system copper resistance phosphate regulon response regulator CusR